MVSTFNQNITSVMEKTTEGHAKANNITIIKKISVPGAFEIPFAAKKLFESREVDAVVVLGVVIQGKTDHDVTIVNTIAPKLLDLSLENNKPLGFGVIGPRVSREEAVSRAEEYARRAVEAVLELQKI